MGGGDSIFMRALTLSAISLRLLKWGIVAVWAPPPMDAYRVVAWLGWGLNLLIVEVWLGYFVPHAPYRPRLPPRRHPPAGLRR